MRTSRTFVITGLVVYGNKAIAKTPTEWADSEGLWRYHEWQAAPISR
jgi:hypothetical protein